MIKINNDVVAPFNPIKVPRNPTSPLSPSSSPKQVTTYSPSSPPPSSPATSTTSASVAVPSVPSPSPTISGSFSAPSSTCSTRATSLNGGPPSPLTESSVASSSLRAPFLSIWVNPYPKYGSLVFVTLGFLSVVACHVTPKPGSSCIDPSPLLWAPVFEITVGADRSMQFFFHDHEGDFDFLHPGLVNWIEPNCNILFLEVEPCHFVSSPPPSPPPPPPLAMHFSGLNLEDEQMLLELVADQVRLKLPNSLYSCFPSFFPQSTDEEAGGGDLGLLEERRLYLIKMYNNLRRVVVNCQLLPGLSLDGSQIAKIILDRLMSFASNCNENCTVAATTSNSTAIKRKTVARTFIDEIKQAFGRSNCDVNVCLLWIIECCLVVGY